MILNDLKFKIIKSQVFSNLLLNVLKKFSNLLERSQRISQLPECSQIWLASDVIFSNTSFLL